MKAIYIICTMLVTGSLNIYAASQQGGVDGGGGIGVRCATSTGAPKSFELLDLHEARLNGLQVTYNPQVEGDAVDLMATLFANVQWTPFLSESISQYQSYLAYGLKPLFDGTTNSSGYFPIQFVASLPLSTDVGAHKIMPGCSLEQIAFFDDEAGVLNVAANWTDLDWLNRAALISHEFVYRGDRNYGMEYIGAPGGMTSVRARGFVGQLFSIEGIIPHADSLPPSGYAICDSGSKDWYNRTYFYVFDDGLGNVSAVIDSIQGRNSAYQMKSSFSGVTLKDLLTHAGNKLSFSGALTFSGEPDVPSFVLKFAGENDGGIYTFNVFEDESGNPAPVMATQMIQCFKPPKDNGSAEVRQILGLERTSIPEANHRRKCFQ